MTKLSSENKSFNNFSFGIMCAGNSLQKWQANSVNYLLQKGIRCKLLIVDDNQHNNLSLIEKINKYINKKGLYQLYLRFFLKPAAKQEVKIEKVLPSKTEIIKCKTDNKGFSQYFNEKDIKTIKSKNLDFILRFGFNIIRGEILNSALYGVWSFHHDDEQKYRGGPPGFWEIFNNDNATGSILQRLTDKLDGGIILKKGYYKTVKHSYKGQIDKLYFETAKWPLYVCNEIINNPSKILNSELSTTKAKIFKAPDNGKMVKFWFKLLKNKIVFHYNEFFKPEQWNIAVKENGKIYWMPISERSRFFADPFALKINDKLHILFENYSYKKEKGVISQVTFSNGKFSNINTALEEKEHLSYPFLFEHNNKIYCIPESVAEGQVKLYSYNPETRKLIFEKVLINFPGADPTLLRYNEKWWLFCTYKENTNTDLYLFYANDLNEDFIQHKCNPVKLDINNARPGGKPFYKNNELFRPAQNSSGTYGQNIVINKINTLSETQFEEIHVKNMLPVKKSKFKKGMHTYSVIYKYEIFDGKRFKFNTYNLWHQINRKVFKK